MNSNEKAEMLKDTIFHLYSNEGRSYSYISRLLDIPRQVISRKVKEWNLPIPVPKKHMNPSTEKFFKRHRDQMISLLKNGYSASEIARRLNFNRRLFVIFCANDSEFDRIYQACIHPVVKISSDLTSSSRPVFHEEDNMEGEIWKPVLGWETYKVSNMGRIIHLNPDSDEWIVLKPTPNINNGRMYVRMKEGDKNGNYQLHRLIAFAFCDGYSEERNTVNHKDGNVKNNIASNLEWVSQAENNTHAYRVLNRPKVRVTKKPFQKLIYDGQYEFKTVSALARFLHKSPTQVRRYLEKAEAHNIQIIM